MEGAAAALAAPARVAVPFPVRLSVGRSWGGLMELGAGAG